MGHLFPHGVSLPLQAAHGDALDEGALGEEEEDDDGGYDEGRGGHEEVPGGSALAACDQDLARGPASDSVGTQGITMSETESAALTNEHRTPAHDAPSCRG